MQVSGEHKHNKVQGRGMSVCRYLGRYGMSVKRLGEGAQVREIYFSNLQPSLSASPALTLLVGRQARKDADCNQMIAEHCRLRKCELFA